jgi:flagellar biogenesis protein FliO
MCAVLAACVGSLWLARRWLPGAAMSQPGKGRMRVVDTLPLARRCWIQLVEVEGRPVLIGYDAGGMRNITPLPPSFADEFNQEAEEAGNETSLSPISPFASRVGDGLTGVLP